MDKRLIKILNFITFISMELKLSNEQQERLKDFLAGESRDFAKLLGRVK